MNEKDKIARSEYDEKWLGANHAHIAGKIVVPKDQSEEYVRFFVDFGRAHGFTILVDRDRPGPPGTLPSILMTRNDGVQIDTSDFLVTRAGFGLRQPAPRDEWKSVGEDLLRELVAKFGDQVVVERGVWLPLADRKLVAALWGASRDLNLRSERLFAGTRLEHSGELMQTSECMGKPCVLSYHFVNDRLFRVRLTIPDLGPQDYVPIYQNVAEMIGELYGPRLGDVDSVMKALNDGRSTGEQVHAFQEVDSMRWEVNYMRVDWLWTGTADAYQAVLEYSHLDHLP